MGAVIRTAGLAPFALTAALLASGCGVSGRTATGRAISASLLIDLEYARPRVGSPDALLSTVQLVPSASVARQDVEADRTRSVQDCVGSYWNAASGARGPLVDNHATIAPLHVPLPTAGFAFSATDRERSSRCSTCTRRRTPRETRSEA
jgi:hypothetical protein